LAVDDVGIAGLPPIQDYLRELATSRQLSDVAVAVCTLRFPESAPALRAVLARAADGEVLEDDEARLLFRGLYILGGRRDQDSFPLLLRLLRRPDDELEWLLGDAITESLPKIAAGMFDGNIDALFDAIVDRRLDEFSREALLGAACFLAWKGRIARDLMERFLERFYEERLAEPEDYAWIGWLEAIALLGLRSLALAVERAWSDGWIPEGVLDPSNFAVDLAQAEREPDNIERFKKANLGYIDDVLEALAWTCRGENDEWDDDSEDLTLDEATELPRPVVNPMRHVGRNDPCPCGSGKKAKRCCLVR